MEEEKSETKDSNQSQENSEVEKVETQVVHSGASVQEETVVPSTENAVEFSSNQTAEEASADADKLESNNNDNIRDIVESIPSISQAAEQLQRQENANRITKEVLPTNDQPKDSNLIANNVPTKINDSHANDSVVDRMVAFDAPTMISDLETQLQFFIRPEFQLLEILCHVNGFVEDTTYLFLDLAKLMAVIFTSDEKAFSDPKLALTNFVLPRLALKSDDMDLNHMKLIFYLQPFQKHVFNGDLTMEEAASSTKFQEPPLFTQVIVTKPEGLELTPYPTTIDKYVICVLLCFISNYLFMYLFKISFISSL